MNVCSLLLIALVILHVLFSCSGFDWTLKLNTLNLLLDLISHDFHKFPSALKFPLNKMVKYFIM